MFVISSDNDSTNVKCFSHAIATLQTDTHTGLILLPRLLTWDVMMMPVIEEGQWCVQLHKIMGIV